MEKESLFLGCVGIAIALGLLSCSWFTEFVVVNRSDLVLTVTYRLDGTHSREPGCPELDHVLPKRFAWKDRGQYPWPEVPRSELEYDDRICQIRVDLQPGYALRLMITRGYAGHQPRQTWLPGLATLTLESQGHRSYTLKSSERTNRGNRLGFRGCPCSVHYSSSDEDRVDAARRLGHM